MAKRVRAERRAWAPLLELGPVISLRCCGLSPSGPPAESLGKDLIAWTISPSNTVMAGRSADSTNGGIEESG